MSIIERFLGISPPLLTHDDRILLVNLSVYSVATVLDGADVILEHFVGLWSNFRVVVELCDELGEFVIRNIAHRVRNCLVSSDPGNKLSKSSKMISYQ